MTPGDFDKISKFASRELDALKRTGSQLIFQHGDSSYVIKDWTITVDPDGQAICKKPLRDPVIFFSKTCAIIYVLSEISNRCMWAISISRLDEQVGRYTTDAEILQHKMRKNLKSQNYDRFGLLSSKYTETKSRLDQAVLNVKKYCRLTKYNKGMMS